MDLSKVSLMMPPSLFYSHISWEDYYWDVLMPILREAVDRGYRTNLLLHSPFGTYRPPTGEKAIDAVIAGRRRNGPSDNDPSGYIALHPEAYEWALMTNPIRVEGFKEAVQVMQANDFTVSVWVGGFHWLTAPNVMAYEPLPGLVNRIVFDSASDFPLEQKHVEFLQEMRRRIPRIGLEGIRSREELKPPAGMELWAKLANYQLRMRRGEWAVVGPHRVYLLCDGLDEVETALSLGTNPVRLIRRSDWPMAQWPRVR